MNRRTGETPTGRHRAICSRSDDNGDPEPNRIVAAGEHSSGVISYDDLGQPRWTWVTELGETRDTGDTFNYLKALDTDVLSIADDPGASSRAVRKEAGYNPYDTAAVSSRRRIPRGR